MNRKPFLRRLNAFEGKIHFDTGRYLLPGYRTKDLCEEQILGWTGKPAVLVKHKIFIEDNLPRESIIAYC